MCSSIEGVHCILVATSDGSLYVGHSVLIPCVYSSIEGVHRILVATSDGSLYVGHSVFIPCVYSSIEGMHRILVATSDGSLYVGHSVLIPCVCTLVLRVCTVSLLPHLMVVCMWAILTHVKEASVGSVESSGCSPVRTRYHQMKTKVLM